VVTLCSNPSTGFQWSENAEISDPAVLGQYRHEFLPNEGNGVVGAAGSDVWKFRSLKKGTSGIHFEHSRPWEGGEKGEWTLELVVTVK
jgi:predicted secreted protein